METVPFLAGVIEGFYGRPWSTAQRRQLFKWLQAARLNTYLYAPKDDLKHRALWREPYDSGECKNLASLIDECHGHRIQFLYAIAPGLDIRFSSPADRNLLVRKLKACRNLGADGFALLFDDIPAALEPEDQRRFGHPASAQTWLANEVHAALTASAPPCRLLFCPTVYCGRMAQPSVADNHYLRILGESLAPGIDILWTGPHIVSETISVDSIQEIARVLRRRPILWDNLFANDYDMRRLYLGPFDGRSADLAPGVAGILLNPNCQFEANFPGIHTFGRYLADPRRYAPSEAHRRALEHWLSSFNPATGDQLRLEELELLADCLHLPTQFGPQGRRFLADFDLLRCHPPSAWGDAESRLLATCTALETVYDKLTRLSDRSLLHALYVHAWELKETGQFLRQWVAWRRNAPPHTGAFCSPDYRPGIHRGGLVARIEAGIGVPET